jgi:hypothetical protein
MQEMIDKEEDDQLIFMEEVDEGVETATNHVEEEEIDPPINFHEQFSWRSTWTRRRTS